ncbi:MAG: hypothetical protein CRN43_03310 [Candidatus Nephrothrix sp. EaCA]|nr:MAG: hypothetical protein CRN43_03310 [Candidatus Nephrothrix sp. EaCA]
MKATETKLLEIIEGTKQYVIPLFQRTYSWTKKEWEDLWEDLVALSEMENPRTHFIGSIVNMQTVSVPEGVAKFLLIDGQQRLTTIFVLLILLRNKAKESQNQEFADEINNTLLVNPYKRDNDFYKLMPTQVDREAYQNLINGNANDTGNQLTRAYAFFDKKLKQAKLEPEKLKKIIISYFSMVSILLEGDDNPYLVFESLNAKGRPLTQADLIRNYFFMRVHVDDQEDIYKTYWQPMQSALSDSLTEYIRHFLMRDGNIIKQRDVYYALKESVANSNAVDYLKELRRYSVYYQRLKFPESEPEIELKRLFRKLNRIEVTTAYPLLLNFYSNYDEGKISKVDFVDILSTLENYLIRRFVCDVPTNQLNKIFPAVYLAITAKYPGNIVEGFKNALQSRGYPKDSEFFLHFTENSFYSVKSSPKTKLILETLEEKFAHKEKVPFDNLSLEHIMPQTLSEWWQKELGGEWEETHELLLHTIGNLTLTAYNPELSNNDFPTKKKTLNESHLELNKYFSSLPSWTGKEIEQRSEILAESALKIWKYFGQENSTPPDLQGVTRTTPFALKILGQQKPVDSWRDVLVKTLNTIADLEPEKFEVIAHNCSRYLGKDKNKFRTTKELKNGYFIEVNLSAKSIRKFCYQALETVELGSEWKVEVR